MQFEMSDTRIIKKNQRSLTQRITFFEYMYVFVLIIYAGPGKYIF